MARLLDRLDQLDRWASFVVALCSSKPLTIVPEDERPVASRAPVCGYTVHGAEECDE